MEAGCGLWDASPRYCESHLTPPLSCRASLTLGFCIVPLHSGQDPSTYLDQSDFFYASPATYLTTRFPALVNTSFPPSPFPSHAHPQPPSSDLAWRHEWPSHLVVFQALLDDAKGEVGELLRSKGYEEERRLWNSHWHEDERRRGDVVVLRWQGTA